MSRISAQEGEKVNPRTLLKRALSPTVVMLVLILLAFLLRIYRINWQSLWTDENYTFNLTMRDLASITQTTSADVHPPLYYYLVHFWLPLTGQSEFSLRFLSLLFSLLLVPLMFKLGSRLASRRVGIIAALLTAIGPFQVYYAQEARMYSLMVFLSVLSTYSMVRVAGFGRLASQTVGTGRNWQYWITLVLSSALLLYAHYFGALVLVFQSTMILLTRIKQWDLVWRWILSQALVIVLFAPWIPATLRTYVTNDEEWRRFIPFLQMFQETMVSLGLSEGRDATLYLALATSFFLALLLGIVTLAWRQRSRPLLLFLGLYLFQPILVTYALSYSKPVYGSSRYLIFVAPAFYLLISCGLVTLRDRWRPIFVALASCLVLASGYALSNNYFNEAYAKDNYRALARIIESRAAPEDGVVVMNGVVFDYYYKGTFPRMFLPQQYPLNQGNVIDLLNGFSKGKSRLWYVRWHFNGVDPDDFILSQLEDHSETIEDASIRGLRYTLFKLDPDVPFGAAIQRPLSATFENKLSVVGYSLSPEQVAAGRTLNVSIFMKATEKLDQDYKVSLVLSDSQGYRWAQNDRPPTGYSMSRWRPGELVETRLALPIPLGMPPGQYHLGIVVYAPNNLRPVAVLDSNLAPVGTSLRLSSVQVKRGQLPYALSAIGSSQRVDRDLAQEIRLLAYDAGAAELDQGGNLTLALYWQALSQPGQEYRVSVKLLDENGITVQETIEKPAQGKYPTTAWQEGEIVRDLHVVPVAGNARPGNSRVVVSLIGPDSANSQGAELGSVLVKERPRSFQAPNVERPLEAALEGGISFLGYGIEDELQARPGGTLGLTLYWQATADATGNYAVFTHLLDGENRVWGQHDGAPSDGTQPTSGWVAGQTVTDKHRLAIKPDARPGSYTIEIGMYDPTTGARVRQPNGEDRILLGAITVR